MITFYSKASDGTVCRTVLKNWDYVNLTLLCFNWEASESGIKFSYINENEFNKLSKGKRGERQYLTEHESTHFAGYYEVYVLKKTN